MKKYIEAAKKAHGQLMTLVEAATTDAQDRISKAKEDATPEEVSPLLVVMLNNAAIPADGAVTGIIATYAALLNNPGTRDGVFLIRHLVSAAKHHGLKDEQAAQIAGAILAAIKGNAPASLIEWPAADDWQEHLHYSDLKQWAAYLAPAEYRQFEERTKATAKARISAETDLVQLKRARQALEDMVPKKKSSATVNIKNLTERKTGVSGIRWEAGETMALGTEAFAQVIDSPGFQKLLETKTFEVVA
jgi:hypothetical protein